jgi:hypothetical protein
MAVLALGVVGSALGSAIGIGASAGWLGGVLLGNLLFGGGKGQNIEGPRLMILSVQTSTYGRLFRWSMARCGCPATSSGQRRSKKPARLRKQAAVKVAARNRRRPPTAIPRLSRSALCARPGGNRAPHLGGHQGDL